MTDPETIARLAGTPPARTVMQDARAVNASLRALQGDVRRLVEDGTRQHPFATLALAAGCGFVLAGGLAPRVSRGLWAIGTRIAMNAIVRGVLEEVGGRRQPTREVRS